MDFFSLQETNSDPLRCTCGNSLLCICIIYMDFGIPVKSISDSSIAVETDSTISTDISLPVLYESSTPDLTISSDITDIHSENQDKVKQHLDDLVCNLTGEESDEECTKRFLEYRRINHCIDQKRHRDRKRERDRIKKGLAPINSTIFVSKKRKSRRDIHWKIKMTEVYQLKKSTNRSRKN